MGSYKVVFRIDSSENTPDIMWEEGCPILLDALQIARDSESGVAYLQSKFENVSGRMVNAFEVEFTVALRDGSEEKHCLSPLDADIKPSERYVAEPIKLANGDVISARADVRSVRTESDEWVSRRPASKLPSPVRLDLSGWAHEERVRELREMGCRDSEAASYGTFEIHEGWTLCPCGQVNVGITRCLRCGLDLSQKTLGQSEDESFLLSAAKAREEKEGQDLRKKREKTERRKRKALKIGIPILVICLLCVGFWGVTDYLPRKQAEARLSEFKSSNQLYDYDEFVSEDAWDSKAASYSEGLDELIGSSYSALSEESKMEVLKMLAKEQTIDAIYSDVKSSWPSSVSVSLFLLDASIEDNTTRDGAFDVVIDCGSRVESGKHHYSFRSKYRETFIPDLENGTVDGWPLQRKSIR